MMLNRLIIRSNGILRTNAVCSLRGGLIGYRSYSNIEDFNKKKTHYTYGANFESLEDLEKEINPQDQSTQKIHQKIQDQMEQEQQAKMTSFVNNHPKLINLEPGSPQYKEQLYFVQLEYEKSQRKQRKRFEFYERLRAMGVGILALVAIIGTHYVYMHYPYLKTKALANINYKIDEDKAPDLSDPNKNTKNNEYLINKLNEELTSFTDLKNSEEVAGLYVFGQSNNQKLPMRFDFFNQMLIKDVKLLNDYLVVVNEKGQVYEYYKGLKVPKLINLPYKIDKVEVSNNVLYFKTNKGEIIYIPRRGSKPDSDFQGTTRRNWIGISQDQTYAKLNIGESIDQFSTGENHILLLGKSGKLYIANTSQNPINKGQYGIPDYSPFSKDVKIPTNEPFEMTLLNNEIYQDNQGNKSLISRRFKTIASGKYHNIVVDTSGNVWTWGKNNYGECGINMNYNTDLQPIPKKILQLDDYKRICRNALPSIAGGLTSADFNVKKVFASDDSSYVQLEYNNDQDILLSFGNGLKGQLGNNRYLHVCSSPQIIKSLINLTEFNESLNKVETIGIKDVNVGNNHLFITLNNSGKFKDVLVVGDNESGQFGNGKVVRSSKPVQIPKLIEPKDLLDSKSSKNSSSKLSKKINDANNSRLQLLDDHKLINNSIIEQVIVAGENGSAIFYKRK
ncbi:regulator of chromosome condensation 1/beta-lactamase-inhibitor protein II [Scheffersomyces coipomensis]|uniref:regulator of chromosome condensation 1/beta-lactamase-inhibitor protein II n=1 Tax=Scheffersomyces coipomensis TaxID=1788519 RepID=UPI00315D72DA